MRDIKFRFWDKKNQKFISTIYDGNNKNIAEPYITANGKVFVRKYNSIEDHGENITAIEYTGFKDKNGVEIYEGDVVEYKDYSRGARLFGEQPRTRDCVEWHARECGYHLKGTGFGFKCEKAEVIGNIYENSELLEGVND